jgi:hypothetical protein
MISLFVNLIRFDPAIIETLVGAYRKWGTAS